MSSYLVCVDVSVFVTLDASDVPDLYTERLVLDRVIAFGPGLPGSCPPFPLPLELVLGLFPLLPLVIFLILLAGAGRGLIHKV